MDISLERSRSIVEAMAAVRQAVGDGATIGGLEEAKRILKGLGSRRDLFPESEFPWPTTPNENRMYCLYSRSEDDLALYLDLLDQGASNAPHDHGNSWAIVVGMEGKERHSLFRREDGGAGPGPAELSPAGYLVIGPGDAISLLPQGIHSIAAEGNGRLMMMHCYARPFHAQTGRLEYDLAAMTCAVGVAETGEIHQIDLHPDVAHS